MFVVWCFDALHFLPVNLSLEKTGDVAVLEWYCPKGQTVLLLHCCQDSNVLVQLSPEKSPEGIIFAVL